MSERAAVYQTDEGRASVRNVIHSAASGFKEAERIEALTTNLSTITRDAVRKAIQRSLDQGRELDVLQSEFRGISAALDELDPCARVMAGGGPHDMNLSDCMYCGLQGDEQRVTRRIDDVRRMLGAIP